MSRDTTDSDLALLARSLLPAFFEIRHRLPPALAAMERAQLYDTLAWITAAAAWDAQEPGPLALAIEQAQPPDEVRPMIADIVAGRRPRRLTNSALKGTTRALIAQAMWINREIHADAKARGQTLAAADGREPADVQEWIHAENRKAQERILAITGMSDPGSLADLRKEFEKYLKFWG